MLTRWQQSAVYNVIWEEPDAIAYAKDRFTGWVQQPEGTGPVLFSNTSPTYARLEPVSASAGGGAPTTTAVAAGRSSRSSRWPWWASAWRWWWLPAGESAYDRE